MCWKHPELREGEIYLTNCYEEEELEENCVEDFSAIGWKTKRRGRKAYDINRERIYNGAFPVFVRATELEEAGIDIN